MNREEVMSLQPGRELEELVAIKVMGYTNNHEFQEVHDMEGRLIGSSSWRDDEGDPIILRLYSRHLSAAWEVVEELIGKGIYIDIITSADFYSVIIDDKQIHISHPKLPCAISQAALLAMEGE